MYISDLKHSDKTLKGKLHKLYNLSRGKRMELSFRTQYLDLLEKFGNPHLSLPTTIHVAGTNGKGSIIAILKAIYEAANKHVHTYTSPHLHRFNERIILAGQPIDNKYLETLIDQAIEINNDADITFFEITTAIAFKAFSETPADILLLETGLGGRLDCTNVIQNPTTTIINTVSYDHTEFLGNALEDIASEKAGIIKPNTPCIIGPQTCSLEPFKKLSESLNSPLFCYGSDWSITAHEESFDFEFQNGAITCPLPALQGTHQIHNAGAALAAIKLLTPIHPVSHKNICDGLKTVKWPGRLQNITQNYTQILPENWQVFYDGGHNQAAGETLAKFIKTQKHVHLIIGMMKHKNPTAFLKPMLPHIESITCIPIPNEPNSLNPKELQDTLHNEDLGSDAVNTATNAQEAIKNLTTRNSQLATILITGSLYLANQILNQS